MPQTLRQIAEEATSSIIEAIGHDLPDDTFEAVEQIIEKTVIRSLLEGQHRAVDACVQCPEADQDTAHKIANEIRRKNDVLITNLSSLR